MLGNAAVYATSRTQHCVTLSTTEAAYVALAEGGKDGMFVRSAMSFVQPNVYEISLMQDNKGAKAMAARAGEVPRVGELAAAVVAPRPRSLGGGRAGCARATSSTSVTAPNRSARGVARGATT